jgi:hypothetical protein
MSRASSYPYSRGAPYSYNDWLRDIRVELNIPPGGSEAYLRDKVKYDKIRTKNVRCPPGYKYKPNRKPGQRKCRKEKVRIYLSFLQKLAKRNKISIFKMRKDKKGYTRTLLTIPQLKSRLTRNGISYKMNKFGVLPMGGGKGPEEPEDPRIAAYAIEKKRKIAEQNRKWRAAKAAETADKYEAIREAGMDRAAADAIRYMGMTARERTTAMAKQRRLLAKQAKEYMAAQAAAQALLASASGAGSSSSGAGPSTSGLDFTIPDVDFGRTRYNYGMSEVWQ